MKNKNRKDQMTSDEIKRHQYLCAIRYCLYCLRHVTFRFFMMLLVLQNVCFSFRDVDGEIALVWRKTGSVVLNPPTKGLNAR